MNPTLELPASAVELATPGYEQPAVTPRAAPAQPVRATAADAEYPRTASPRQTARAQYLESEEYEPLAQMLIGLPRRAFLIAAILIAYNVALGVIAVQVATSTDRRLVIAVIGIGAVAGGAGALMERPFGPRARDDG